MPNEVPTDDLLEELLSGPNAESFQDVHPNLEVSLPEYLEQLLRDKDLKKSQAIRASKLNETFGYQIFSGDRNPSRDKVIQLAYGCHCSLLETQRLLKRAGVSELYVKDRRDAVIAFCISRGMTLDETDEQLYRLDLTTLVAEDDA